jgi:hypothetical protein
MGGVRAYHLSHRGCLATRAAEPDCDGIGDGADTVHRAKSNPHRRGRSDRAFRGPT